jgi:hypothetical protein
MKNKCLIGGRVYTKIPKFICSRCDKKKPETECFCESCIKDIKLWQTKYLWFFVEDYIHNVKRMIPFELLLSHGVKLDDRKEYRKLRKTFKQDVKVRR